MKKELNYIRAILCLLIITTHLLTEYTIQLQPDEPQLTALYYIRNIIIFATPGFIILSVMLTTLNYRLELPKGYLWERIKYILIPYVIIGIFFSWSASMENGSSLKDELLSNVVRGEWHGYFILVIIQFIILNIIVYKINPAVLKSKIMLLISFVISAVYLIAYYHMESVHSFVENVYPFSSNTVIFGWLFFYFLGAYSGANYFKIQTFMKSQSAIIILLLLISYGLFILFNNHDYWTVTSFHYSLILYHTTAFFLILYIAGQVTDVLESLILLISKYSLFIFLFHPIIIPYLFSYTSLYSESTVIFLVISVVLTLGLCIGTGIILSHFKMFRFVIGKLPYK